MLTQEVLYKVMDWSLKIQRHFITEAQVNEIRLLLGVHKLKDQKTLGSGLSMPHSMILTCKN